MFLSCARARRCRAQGNASERVRGLGLKMLRSFTNSLSLQFYAESGNEETPTAKRGEDTVLMPARTESPGQARARARRIKTAASAGLASQNFTDGCTGAETHSKTSPMH